MKGQRLNDIDQVSDFDDDPELARHGYHPESFYPKACDDGADARVDVERLPAEAFRVVVAPSVNSCGTRRPGFMLSTGTGEEMRRLCHAIAEAASEGMIGFDADPNPLARTVPE